MNAAGTPLARRTLWWTTHLLLWIPIANLAGNDKLLGDENPTAQLPTAQLPSLELIDDFNIATGTPFESIGKSTDADTNANHAGDTTRTIDSILRDKVSGDFGGISAIAFDPVNHELFALSDTAKPIVFVFGLSMDHETLQLQPLRAMPLTDQGGAPLAQWSMDPEGLALLPQGELLIASEGYPVGIARAGVAPMNPALHKVDSQGRLIASIDPPSKVIGLGDDPSGVHRNHGLESLSVSPRGDRLLIASEGTLRQDGPPTDLIHGGAIRIFQCSLDDRNLTTHREYLYRLDPPPIPAGFRRPVGARGLTELLALNEHQTLALERSFLLETEGEPSSRRSAQQIEVYHLDLSDGSDISGLDRLRNGPEIQPVGKNLILDLGNVVSEFDLEYQSLDNFEGMCFGPTLADGSRTVLLVSDNNFNPDQRTTFLAFKLVFP